MRRTWSAALLLVALTGLACASKPKRVLREPAEQYYGLPDMANKTFSDPPTYPDSKLELPNQKNSAGGQANPSGLGNAGRSGMGGPGMGGGGPGMGGAGGPGGMNGYR